MKVTYKGKWVHKPDNMSVNQIKTIIDKLGGDYSCTLQEVVDLISNRFIPRSEK
jgi:hypothetical protein